MKFTIRVDGIKYTAAQNNIDEYIEDVLFNIKHPSESSSNNFQIISDCEDVTKYLLDKIIKNHPEFELFDLSTIQELSLKQLLQKAENIPMIVYGFEKYIDFINDKFYNNATCTVCGKIYKEAQKKFYTVLELGRDSFFAKFKTHLIFIMSEEEYEAFINLADDFASYYPENFDFNRALYSEEYENESLSDYLIYVKRGLTQHKKRKDDKK